MVTVHIPVPGDVDAEQLLDAAGAALLDRLAAAWAPPSPTDPEGDAADAA